MKFKNMHYPVLVAVGHIPELLQVKHTEKGITVGASTTLSDLKAILRRAIDSYPGTALHNNARTSWIHWYRRKCLKSKTAPAQN